MSPTSYDYETTIIWIQEFIDFPRPKETISASLFFITQIQNNAGIWGTIQMEVVPPPPPPPACSKFKEHSTEIEEVQSHWKGFCISMWLKCVTLSGRKGLNPFKHQLSSREPSCSLFCSPNIFVLNHCKDFPRLTVHLLVVHHIPWQQVPQFTWLWVKKSRPLKDIYFPVKNSGNFFFESYFIMDPVCCPFFLHFLNYCRHVIHIFHFTSGTPLCPH